VGFSQNLFKPLSTVVPYEIKAKGIVPKAGENVLPAIWMPRIAASITAIAVDFSESPALTVPLSSLGFGMSYGKYVVANEKPYCQFSVNALLLTQIKIGEEVSTKLGGALTVDVFNKLIGIGIGYVDKKALLLTTVSFPL